MSAPRAINEVLAAIAAAMRENKTRWFLFGAEAASLWGRPRLSNDVDVTAMVDRERLTAFIRVMKAHGFELGLNDVEFIERSRVLPFIHRPTSYPIDVVLAGPGIEEEFMNRAVVLQVRDTRVPVISPEDLIITKILAGRSKDIDDVRGVLRERADSLDLSRIRTLLRLLEEALTRGDLLSVFENELARIVEE